MSTISSSGSGVASGDGGPLADATFGGTSTLASDAAGYIVIASAGPLRIVDPTRTTVVDVTWPLAPNGDGGPATSASLASPVDAVRIGATLYVAEFFPGRIRAIDLVTGIITTVAGSGVGGTSGDGGPATNAMLYRPVSLARYGNGLLVGTSAGTIRYVDLNSGIITRFAGTGEPGHTGDGGPRLSARIGAPSGIAATNDGRVYFSDNLSGGATDGRVRCIGCDGSDVVSTVVDTTTAPTTGGVGRVAIDPNGAVAFSIGTAVLRWDPTTDDVETIAGSPSTPGDSGDEGPATSARLTAASALRYRANGDLYIADAAAHRVRRIDRDTGTIHAYAGTGTAGYSGDGGPATAAQLAVPWALEVGAHTYVLEVLTGVVRRIEGSGSDLRATATDTSLAVGGTAAITVTADNDSETDVTGPIVATATAPTGLEFVSADSPDGWDCTVDATELACTHEDNLAPSASRAFAVDVTATGAQTGAIELDTTLISDAGASATATAIVTVVSPTTTTSGPPTTSDDAVAEITEPDTPAPRPVNGTLPRTGSTGPAPTIAFAVLLVASGLALVATSRRFRRATWPDARAGEHGPKHRGGRN